jgi:hypothetical protein
MRSAPLLGPDGGLLGTKVSKLRLSIDEYYCTKLYVIVHIHFFEYEKLCLYWFRLKAYLPCFMGVSLTVSDIKGITQSLGKIFGQVARGN